MDFLFKYINKYFLWILIFSFVAGEVYMLTYKRPWFYPYNLLPIVAFVVYVAVFHLQQLVYLISFSTPLAISLKEMGLTQGPDLSIPTEPLMIGMMLVYILNSMQRQLTDRQFMRHPLTWIISIQIVWMLITTLSSSDLTVSVKYLISRLWFVFSCYIIMQHLFVKRENIVRFIMAYASALLIVVIYTTIVHAQYNFNDKAADWVVSPFYNDHTAYGAALAMFIPVMMAIIFMKSTGNLLKMVCIGLFVAFMIAIIISFARAGWLSLVVAIGILFTTFLRVRFKTLLATIIVGTVLFLSFRTEILIALSRNNTDAEGGFENNVESVSNISTDASNLERLNRWSCAIRMWEDKPVLGWGPGTYMFKYAPYQLSKDLTIISTNFGTNGNAHSEYLGPLAEQGILGLLIVAALLLYVSSLGYKLIYQLENYDDRVLCTGLFLGVMTYFVHGFFNNFLDTDKLSLPFWGFLAAMVCFDLYYPHKSAHEPKK